MSSHPRLRLLAFAAGFAAALFPLNSGNAQTIVESDLKTITPFVSETLSVVARIDVAELDIETLAREAAVAVPGFPPAEIEQVAIPTAAALVAANAKVVYLVFNVDLLVTQSGQRPLVVVPVRAQTDVAKVSAALGRFGAVEQIGGLVLMGNRDQIEREKARRTSARPELEPAMIAAGEHAVRIAVLPSDSERKVVEQMLPNLPPNFGGLSTAPVAKGLSWISAGFNIGRETNARIVIASPDATAAANLREFLGQLLQHISPLLDAGAQRTVARFRAEVQGSRLVVSLKSPVSIRDLLETELNSAVKASIEARIRAQAMDKVKQIVLAMHNYYDRHHTLPPAAICAKDGAPLLSWRVAILPFIDRALYDKFHLDEPWDSPHNRALIPSMPEVYRWPMRPIDPEFRTNFLVPIGESTAFPRDKAIAFNEIKDGTSRTIGLVEADDAHAAVWTKPDDWNYDVEHPLDGLGGHFSKYFLVGVCDSSVHVVHESVDLSTFRAMFTANGGEVLMIP